MTDTLRFARSLAASAGTMLVTSLLGALVCFGAACLLESPDPAFAPIAAVGAWMFVGRGLRRFARR